MNTTKTQQRRLMQIQVPKDKTPHILTSALQKPQTHNGPPAKPPCSPRKDIAIYY